MWTVGAPRPDSSRRTRCRPRISCWLEMHSLAATRTRRPNPKQWRLAIALWGARSQTHSHRGWRVPAVRSRSSSTLRRGWTSRSSVRVGWRRRSGSWRIVRRASGSGWCLRPRAAAGSAPPASAQGPSDSCRRPCSGPSCRLSCRGPWSPRRCAPPGVPLPALRLRRSGGLPPPEPAVQTEASGAAAADAARSAAPGPHFRTRRSAERRRARSPASGAALAGRRPGSRGSAPSPSRCCRCSPARGARPRPTTRPRPSRHR